jgi:hypothetical protein
MGVLIKSVEKIIDRIELDSEVVSHEAGVAFNFIPPSGFLHPSNSVSMGTRLSLGDCIALSIF